jgi:hypothetical protein
MAQLFLSKFIKIFLHFGRDQKVEGRTAGTVRPIMPISGIKQFVIAGGYMIAQPIKDRPSIPHLNAAT